MPQQAWSNKRERQYEHIKEGLKERGRSEDTAEEIAARTVNKDRAQHGEADQASRSSTHDMSPSRRGGKRSPASRMRLVDGSVNAPLMRPGPRSPGRHSESRRWST